MMYYVKRKSITNGMFFLDITGITVKEADAREVVGVCN